MTSVRVLIRCQKIITPYAAGECDITLMWRFKSAFNPSLDRAITNFASPAGGSVYASSAVTERVSG